LRWIAHLRQKWPDRTRILFGRKSNSTDPPEELFSDFHGRENHPFSPKGAAGLLGRALGFPFNPLGRYEKKTISSSKGNMSKGNFFVKKIMAGKMRESLA
jgi:hypothetical protein